MEYSDEEAVAGTNLEDPHCRTAAVEEGEEGEVGVVKEQGSRPGLMEMAEKEAVVEMTGGVEENQAMLEGVGMVALSIM